MVFILKHEPSMKAATCLNWKHGSCSSCWSEGLTLMCLCLSWYLHVDRTTLHLSKSMRSSLDSPSNLIRTAPQPQQSNIYGRVYICIYIYEWMKRQYVGRCIGSISHVAVFSILNRWYQPSVYAWSGSGTSKYFCAWLCYLIVDREVISQIEKTFGSKSVKHRSGTKLCDRF